MGNTEFVPRSRNSDFLNALESGWTAGPNSSDHGQPCWLTSRSQCGSISRLVNRHLKQQREAKKTKKKKREKKRLAQVVLYCKTHKRQQHFGLRKHVETKHQHTTGVIHFRLTAASVAYQCIRILLNRQLKRSSLGVRRD